MKIAFISDQFPPAPNGVGDYTFHLGAALRQAGLETSFLCREQKTVPLPDGLAVFPVVKTWNTACLPALLETLQTIGPDWIGLQYVPYGFHHLGMPLQLPYLLRTLRKTGARIFITFHEVHIRRRGIKAGIIGSVQREIARQMCRQADAVVTSIDFYRGLLYPFHSDIRVIPVGTNILPVRVEAEERDLRRQQFFPGKKLLLSTFGFRNLTNLLQAVNVLNARGISAGLIVCGKTAGLTVSDPDVFYTGYLPSDQIAAWLQCSDVFVLPDYRNVRDEGGACTKSSALAAAFSAGLPVIGVRGDMTNALLRHKENIWLEQENSVRAFVSAISKLSEDESLRQKLREGGRILFEDYLSWACIARQYRQLFHAEKNVEAAV